MDCFQRIAAAECTTIFTEGQGKLNFENGTLDLSTMTLLPFKREDYLTYCLPYCHTPGKHPTINHFLKETIPDVHARQAYMAHLGLALMQDTLMHFVLLLLGPTRSGKSTLLALANAVCGTSAFDNYAEDFSFAGPSLFSRELEGKRSRSRWVHRRIVCADEIPAEALRDEELFKTMSAHGGVEMRGMHKDEDTANRWKPKLILAANDLPRYKDVAGAVKERCIFVSCPNHRGRAERDPQLFGKLRSEIGAFAATCIELARRVVARGYYPMSYAMKHMTDVLARDGNHVKAFVAECCITGVAEDWSVSETIFAAYLSYCARNGQPSHLPKNGLSSTICNMGIGVSARRGRHEGKVVCGLQGIRLRVDQDPWMTDEEERGRYSDDELLVTSDELLMVVDGRLRVVQRAINMLEEPLEPMQEDMLMVLLAESGNSSVEETYPVEVSASEEGQGGSVENKKMTEEPSTPSTVLVEEPLELDEDVAGTVDGLVISPQQPATPPYQCSVYGCGEVAIVHSENAEEEERTYGLWCAGHQDRSETMRLGMLLSPEYPRVEYALGHMLCEGRQAWLRFHLHAQSSAEMVRRRVRELVEEWWRKAA
jgi:phage/plasmid-associated DNA primase